MSKRILEAEELFLSLDALQNKEGVKK